MPIYTRTGDKGKASLFSNERVWKDSKRMCAYGTIDELNSLLGLVIAELGATHSKYQQDFVKTVSAVQSDLFCIGSSLADSKGELVELDIPEQVKAMEQNIDEMTKTLPELTNFILPQGCKIGATFHVARTVCRRAERELVSLMKKEKINDQIVAYINRLSDLLFTMARYVNFKEKKKERIWRK